MAVVTRLVEALIVARPRLPAAFEGAVVLSTLQDIGALRARLEQAGFSVEPEASRLHEALVLLRVLR